MTLKMTSIIERIKITLRGLQVCVSSAIRRVVFRFMFGSPDFIDIIEKTSKSIDSLQSQINGITPTILTSIDIDNRLIAGFERITKVLNEHQTALGQLTFIISAQEAVAKSTTPTMDIDLFQASDRDKKPN